MSLYRNCTALFSVSVVSVSFLSSCGKGTNNGIFSKMSNASEVVPNIGQGDSNLDSDSSKSFSGRKFCTDLDNAKKNPLGRYQWHLKNTGQTAFATSPGDAGEDINVANVLKKDCLSGNGIYVAVVDTGLELKHPSLTPNIENVPYKSKTWSINFRDNSNQSFNPSPIESDDEDHGTMVSGIIAMRSNLGFGGSGVAPRAQLSAYNIIQNEENVQTFENFVQSLGGSAASEKNDIFSMSYGDNNITQISPTDPVTLGSINSYKYGASHLRDGKGAIYVKAAGNGFNKLGTDPKVVEACKTAVELNVTCQNSSMNTDNTLPQVITVGALSAKGKKTSYSTTGSSLWISAPGGEFGFDKDWINEQNQRFGITFDWSTKRATAGEPAIITTDVSGSAYGMSKRINMNSLTEIFEVRNKFNAGLIEENKDFNYTNSMNGTSSATPVTSGSIALILEANPDLTWRDVKYILAKTATKVDPYFDGVKVKLSGGEYQAEQGWTVNNAGFHFSNWYGFGRVNVEEAVKLAKNYKLGSLGKYVERAWHPVRNAYDVKIPKGDPNVEGFILPSIKKGENVKIESVRLEVSIDSKFIGDVGIELISPSGTKSIVWNIGNAFSNNGSLKNMPIQSNAFYGEDSAGEWKVRVINSGMHETDATLKGLRIQFAGQDSSI